MSGNMFQYLGQTLAAWLRAFANKLEPRVEESARQQVNSGPAAGPPAHWLERVRKDAPQLLHSERPAPPARASRALRAEATTPVSDRAPAKSSSTWPIASLRPAASCEL